MEDQLGPKQELVIILVQLGCSERFVHNVYISTL